MRASLSSCVLSAFFTSLFFAINVLAHNIKMGAHSRECFHETLHKDDKMTVTFQVGDREFGGAGNLEIDFWVGLLPFLNRLPPFSSRALGFFTWIIAR